MANTFLTGHGLVISSSNDRSSAYKIESGGSLGEVLTQRAVSGGAIALIDEVQVVDKDITLPVVATDDFRALYRFGRDFGTLILGGKAYLGPTDCGSKAGAGTSTVLNDITNGFNNVRISARKTPMKVSIAGDQAYPCYPEQLIIDTPDGLFNSIKFKVVCTLAPTSNGSK